MHFDVTTKCLLETSFINWQRKILKALRNVGEGILILQETTEYSGY